MAREIAHLASPVPSAGGRVIVSPFQFLVTGEDHLRVEGWNSVTGVSLQVSYRFAALGGAILAQRRDLALTADRAVTRLVIPLQPGFLVNMAIFVTGAAPQVGQTFVSVKLIRGLGAAAIVLGLLLQGYLSATQGLGWPGSPIQSSLEGQGALRFITGTTPAAGADIQETTPTGARWELMSVHLSFVTNATAGNRFVRLHVEQSLTETFYIVNPSTAQAPSDTLHYIYTRGSTTGLTAFAWTNAFLPVDVPLLAGWYFRSSVNGFQAGDQFGAPLFIVREWLEVAA